MIFFLKNVLNIRETKSILIESLQLIHSWRQTQLGLIIEIDHVIHVKTKK